MLAMSLNSELFVSISIDGLIVYTPDNMANVWSWDLDTRLY